MLVARRTAGAGALLAAMAWAGACVAADWPQWQYDAGRTACSPEALPETLHLAWVREFPPQETAWKDEAAMKVDAAYLPVVQGGLVFAGSTHSGSLTAFDLATGEERWRFYTDGPVRLAPAAWKDKVFVASDDGHLYGLRAADGGVVWRFRGGPADRWLIGNERLISTWPARGGPVVADGVVFFAAGVWPFMGVFVHALDAETGRVLWTNDSADLVWRRFPHPGAWALSGLSPQGHLAVAGDRLIVPGSRYKPGLFDRRTGEFLGFGEGLGPRVAARGGFAFAGGQVFDVATGRPVRLGWSSRFTQPVLADDAWYTQGGWVDPTRLALRQDVVKVPETTRPDGPTYDQKVLTGTAERLPAARGTVWLRAGSRVVASAKGGLQVLDVSDRRAEPRAVAQVALEGTTAGVLAAGGRLLVVTVEGRLYCFGPEAGEARRFPLRRAAAPGPGAWADAAAAVLEASGAVEGYALVWGLKDGGLVEELVRQSRLHVVAIDADAARVETLRRRLDAAGLHGFRAAAIVGDPSGMALAPYLATLVATEDASRAGLAPGAASAARMLHALRPYGGAVCLATSDAEHARLVEGVKEAGLAGVEVRRAAGLSVLVRAGPLPGAAPWCGQNADAGGTRCSRDRTVRAPLGVLWFGNALSNAFVLPKHGEGPVEQVVGGRLFILGPDALTACDVYTGRVLWTREFAGLARYYNVTKHQRGAHSIGSNFYAVADAVYVAAGPACHVLDPATGETRRRLALPAPAPGKEPSDWQFLLVYEDVLVAGSDPVVDAHQPLGRYYSPTSSRGLVAMDRADGRVLWTREARAAWRHYGIAAGGGLVFAIDRLAPEMVKDADRRGEAPQDSPLLVALDARTGRTIWQSDRFVAEALAYSEEHDVLVSGGAFRGRDGRVLWEAPTLHGYAGDENPLLDSRSNPLWWGKWGLLLCGDTILTQAQRAFDLATGRQKTFLASHGEAREWRLRRSHGCGPMAGNVNLLTFRSGTAAFFDLAGDGGTANLGGFRSGCTSNLLAADGVLNAPDYTRACTCAYDNRASLALVHMPEAEFWTFGANPAPGRLGLNFGAPGDRRDDAGTLWLDWPSTGGPSAEVRVQVRPADARYVRRHSSRLRGGEGLAWVAASAVEGAEEIAVELPWAGRAAGPCTVRLTFAETEDREPGSRVFGVALQGREVLRDFDIAKEAGGARRVLVREFAGIEAPERLRVTLRPSMGRTLLAGLEVVAEAAKAAE